MKVNTNSVMNSGQQEAWTAQNQNVWDVHDIIHKLCLEKLEKGIKMFYIYDELDSELPLVSVFC